MAASNYMTEADTESIWDTSLDTTRFGKVGVRMAEILNFYINGDATSQITNTAVTPICEQLSEEGLLRLIAAAKENAVTDPWLFIQSNVINVMKDLIQENWLIIERMREILTKRYHITTTEDLELPSEASGLIKRTTSD